MTDFKGSIGVFDSGVGGLTVVGALRRRFPRERVLYVADQAHVPYGGRPLEEVRRFAAGISHFLADQGCRAVVMACNISSATALDCVRTALAPLPVLGVIAPAAARAARHAERPLGVIATEGTVRTGAYEREIHLLRPEATVVQVPCPRFVPLVEAGELETPEARDAAREYLTPLVAAGCGSVVLGCTHYPFLLPSLRRAAAELGAELAFIDPAEEMAAALNAALPDLGQQTANAPSRLLTTGDEPCFARQIPLFLPNSRDEVGGVVWRGEALTMQAVANRAG